MGNTASDRKNARTYSLKLSKNTDAALIDKLDSVDSIQGYIKSLIKADTKGDTTMINVTLSNKDCTFDSGNFETIQEAIDFSKGRGGVYTVHISRGDSMGVNLSYNSNTGKFAQYDGWDWETVKESEIKI